MHDFLINYGLFLAQAITLLVTILFGVAGILALVNKSKDRPTEKIEITNINEKYDDIRQAMRAEIFSAEEQKALAKREKLKAKNEKLALKQEQKERLLFAKQQPRGQHRMMSVSAGGSSGGAVVGERSGNVGMNSGDGAAFAATSITSSQQPRYRIFVLEFDGDMRASAVENLREEVTAVLTVASPKDEVVIKLESSGGFVHSYGLAASQLKRIRDRHIPLTVIVDKVAASGGYMMACVADRILAAPFAVIGSIGVLMQLPNFNRLLKKHDIDFEQISAGEFKRTLTIFGENTNKNRQKVQEEVEDAHVLFKAFITEHRPLVNIELIATGEHWYGSRAKDLRLIDDIMTSDDYLLNASEKADLFQVTYSIKKNLLERIGISVHKALAKLSY